MRRYELFSKRNKVVQHDVLQYEWFSEKLRNQIFYIWKFALGYDCAIQHGGSDPFRVFRIMRDTMCREHGLMNLYSGTGRGRTPAEECVRFLMDSQDADMLLDLIELSMLMTYEFEDNTYRDKQILGITLSPLEAQTELNQRFRENGVGYEFLDDILVRKDSEFLHEKAVKPALHLLQVEGFDGALEEFLNAHDHFRKGNYKEAIINASNAFESTMKTICAKRNWSVNGNGNASQLIKAIVDNELIPTYLQTHVNSLKTTLEGLSTVRNKNSGHGQGENSVVVPEHFVNYALHLCGTNIVFLIEAYKDLPEEE